MPPLISGHPVCALGPALSPPCRLARSYLTAGRGLPPHGFDQRLLAGHIRYDRSDLLDKKQSKYLSESQCHRTQYHQSQNYQNQCHRPVAASAMKGNNTRTEAERRVVLFEDYAKMRAAAFSEVPEMSCEELFDLLRSSCQETASEIEGTRKVEKETGAETKKMEMEDGAEERGGGGEKGMERRVVVVDTRSDAECDVSMIPGGTLRQSEFERQRENLQDCTVVCYCTIGLRSGKYAKGLREKHNMEAYNLKGSILAWTHHHYPLTTAYDPKTGSGPLHISRMPSDSVTQAHNKEEDSVTQVCSKEEEGQRRGVSATAGPEVSATTRSNVEQNSESPEMTRKVHVYSDKWALQADGFEAVVFPQGLMGQVTSLIPTWIIAKMASQGK